MMPLRLLGALLFALALGGCAEPPYTNVDNAQMMAVLWYRVRVIRNLAGLQLSDILKR